MKIRNVRPHEEGAELGMTSMIDIVFLLLVFFIFTFNPVDREGDFEILMPQTAQGSPFPPDLVVIVKLSAHADGTLKGIKWGDNPLWLVTTKESLSARKRKLAEDALFKRLRGKIREYVGDETGPGSFAEATEVVLDCDSQLKYKHVINAITHIRGRKVGGETINLVERIKLSRPRRPLHARG